MEEDNLKEKREKIVKGIKNFFSFSEAGERKEGEERGQGEEVDLREKREELVKFVKEKKTWLVFILLALIIGFGVYIRTKNFWLLKDITTGAWLSVDLDSHIYLKYAKQILAQGFLAEIDPTRFVPLGAATANYAFPAYFIYYLYKFLHLFNPAMTLEYADVLYPIVAFGIGMVFFFLLVKRLLGVKVALLGSLFLAIMPAYLQRTMGGSSDHDALGIMFMFMAMYFFVVAWQSKKSGGAVFWGGMAGIATGLTGLSWGAWKFLGLIFSLFVIIEFFLRKVEARKVYLYAVWLVLSIGVIIGIFPLFTLKSLILSVTTAIPIFILVVLIVDLVLFRSNLFKLKTRLGEKIPLSVVSIMVAVVVCVVGLMVVMGPEQLTKQGGEMVALLLQPMGKDRWELTVAEQHQPYFRDWMGQFGPSFGLGLTLPLFLTLFMVGLVILFYNMVKKTKGKMVLSLVFLLFILGVVMSRYSGESVFNGTSFLSKAVYLGSFGVLGILGVYFYLRTFYKDKEVFQQVLGWGGNELFVFMWFLIMAIAARGAIRLVFVFAPVVAALAAYALVYLAEGVVKLEKKVYTYIGGAFLLFILVSPLAVPLGGIIPVFAENSIKQATYSGPPYDRQWQIAGDWVRKNLPEEAVFGHWWDYGYWVQNGWERATVTDGANKIKYWNYLMGRHVLTGQNQTEALEFLYAHNTTHYLIVVDEIGKYTAYSSIGSDKDYDRYSWINTFKMNPQASQETRNGTTFVYQGGFMLDDDFIWQGVVYPRGGAGIGGVFLPVKEKREVVGNQTMVGLEIEQPTAALIYMGKRTDVPLECVYFNGRMLKFEKEGLKGCFRIIPTLDDKGQPENVLGAGMYVSEEGVKALWTNLYIFEQNNPDYDTSAFKLVYEDKYISTLALFQGRVMGPIKIWEIRYPEGFTIEEELRERYLGGNEYLPEYFFEV